MAWSLEHMPSALLRPFVMSFVTTALAPSLDLFAEGAILINKRGERFTDERDKPAYALPDQPDKVALHPARQAHGGVVQRLAAFHLDRARRRLCLCRRLPAQPRGYFQHGADARRARCEACNAGGGARRDACANITQSAGNRPKLGEGPYVALGPLRAVFVHAEGGLAVDREHRVLGEGDKPIAGLYAAGSTGQGGLLLKGHGHHLGWAFASGRRAGRNAALAAGQ